MLVKPSTARVATCQALPAAFAGLRGNNNTARTIASAPKAQRHARALPGHGKLAICSAATLEAPTAPATTDDLVLIPAGKGKAANMKKGDIIKIINTHGQQVVDFWAFSTERKIGDEVMSMHHSRNALQKMIPQAGDTLYTASMKPILTFLEDTGPGVHDTTAAACSYGMYELYLGKEAAEEHDSCTNNMHNALGELGYKLAEDHRTDYYTPAPFNLWMSTLDAPDESGFMYGPGDLEKQKPGDYCTFRAEVDCVAVMSACPWDVSPISGPGGLHDCHFKVYTP